MSARRVALSALVLSVSFLLLSFPARSEVLPVTFTVGSIADARDTAPGDGMCASAAAGCTLRAAIEEAVAAGTPTLIEVPAGNYLLASSFEIPSGAIVIRGADRATTIVDAAGSGRAFGVLGGAALGLERLTIANGNTTQEGGAIRAIDAALSLDTVTISTSATDGYGGGLFAAGSTVTISGSLFDQNTALEGGAVAVMGGELTISDSLFTGGLATDAGGAVAAFAPNSFTITNTIFTGNTAEHSGGAVFLSGAAGAGLYTIAGSSFTGNQSFGGSGGAIATDGLVAPGVNGALVVTGSTFTGNQADRRGGAIASAVSITSTANIFTDNYAPENPDIATPVPSANGPRSLAASKGTYANKVVLTWGDVAGESGYRVYRRGAGEAQYTQIGTTGADVTTYTDPRGCGSGVFQYYVVAALLTGDLPSLFDTGNAAACLPAPAVVTASDGTYPDFIRVTWGNSVGGTGFKVYRSGTATGVFTQIGTTAAGVRILDNLAGCGESWYYRVRAVHADGDSVFSTADVGSTRGCPPAAPGLPDASETLKFKVELSWGDVAGESGYKIFRSLKNAASFTQIATVGPGVTLYADPVGCGSDEFQYKVKSYNANGDSGFSPEDLGFTSSCGFTIGLFEKPAVWLQGTTHVLSWSGEVTTGTMKIDLYKGQTFKSAIIVATPNNGTFSWIVPATLPPGTDYRVKVSWTSNLNINDYSEQFTVGLAVLDVTAPAAGTLKQGDAQTVAWNGPTGGNVKIELFLNGLFKSIVIASTPNTGAYTWTVPATLATGASNTYKLRVTWLPNAAANAFSDEFTVDAAVLDVTAPAAGTLKQGDAQTVAWSGPTGGNVKIELFLNGLFKSIVIASTPNTGTYHWTIPLTLATGVPNTYKLRVTWLSNTAANAFSDEFTVDVPVLDVTAPAAGTLKQGDAQTIAWNGPTGGNVKIELLLNGLFKSIVIASTPNTGTYHWTIPLTLATGVPNTYKLRVTWLSNTAANAFSDEFTVDVPVLDVTAPAAGTLKQGDAQTIAWNGPTGGNVKIELLLNGLFKSIVIASTPNTGTYHWTVPLTLATGASNTYKLRVTWLSNAAANAFSDEFTVDVPVLDVTAPAAGTLKQGDVRTIAWNGPTGGNVKIELFLNGLFKSIVIASAPNTGAYTWTVPLTLATGASNAYKLRVTWLSSAAINAFSDQFTVAAPTLVVGAISPTLLNQAQVRPIAWSGPTGGNVKIELFLNGLYTSTVIASTPNTGTFNWSVPALLPPTPTPPPIFMYRLRVTWLSNTAVYAFSNPFRVADTLIAVLSPTGGEVWTQGSTKTVTWSSSGVGDVKIELFKGTLLSSILVAKTPNDGTQTISVPAVKSTASTYRIKVTWLPDPTVSTFSSGTISIE